jgi:hypothetical protein
LLAPLFMKDQLTCPAQSLTRSPKGTLFYFSKKRKFSKSSEGEALITGFGHALDSDFWSRDAYLNDSRPRWLASKFYLSDVLPMSQKSSSNYSCSINSVGLTVSRVHEACFNFFFIGFDPCVGLA